MYDPNQQYQGQQPGQYQQPTQPQYQQPGQPQYQLQYQQPPPQQYQQQYQQPAQQQYQQLGQQQYHQQPPQQPAQQQYQQPGQQQQFDAQQGPGFSYQKYVPGITGWNDPPKTLFQYSVEQQEALKGIDNPQAFLVQSISSTMERVKQAYESQPAQKRMIEDTEKRMDFLLERLASKKVNEALIAELVVVFKALKQRDFNAAMACTTRLMTSTIDDETRWIVGMKRLIELAVRLG